MTISATHTDPLLGPLQGIKAIRGLMAPGGRFTFHELPNP